MDVTLERMQRPLSCAMRRAGLAGALFCALVAAALAAPAPAAADETVANGDFSYPNWVLDASNYSLTYQEWNAGRDTIWSEFSGKTGQYGVFNSKRFKRRDITRSPNTFSASTFAWRSTQSAGNNGDTANNYQYYVDWMNEGITLRLDTKTLNQYAQCCSLQEGSYLFQDVASSGECVLHVTFKHAARAFSSDAIDRMQLMVGPGYKMSAVPLRRVTSNGMTFGGCAGYHDDADDNQVGYVGMYATTPKKGLGSYTEQEVDGYWQTYEAYYYSPASETNVRLAFVAASAGTTKTNPVDGNYIDDICIERCYPVVYDANGGGGTVPHAGPYSDVEFGKYFAAGDRATLATHETDAACTVFDGAVDDAGNRYAFVGWSAARSAWCTTAEQLAAAGVTAVYPVTASFTANKVYAVYMLMPIVTYVDAKTGAELGREAVDFGTAIGDLVPPEREGYAVASAEGPATIEQDATVTVAYRRTSLELTVPVAFELTCDGTGAITSPSYTIVNECDVPLRVSALQVEADDDVAFAAVSQVAGPDEVGLRLGPQGGDVLELADFKADSPRPPGDPDQWVVPAGGALALQPIAGKIGGFSRLDPALPITLGTVRWVVSTVDG